MWQGVIATFSNCMFFTFVGSDGFFYPFGRQVIFCKTPVGASSFFAKLPLAPDVFSSPKNVATPRELSYL